MQFWIFYVWECKEWQELGYLAQRFALCVQKFSKVLKTLFPSVLKEYKSQKKSCLRVQIPVDGNKIKLQIEF